MNVKYALALTSSPLMMYLVAASIGDLYGGAILSACRAQFSFRKVRALAILVPFLWLGLNMILNLSTTGFNDSPFNCDPGFRRWLHNITSVIFDFFFHPGDLLPPQILFPTFGPLFILCLFRRRSYVVADVRAYWKKTSKRFRHCGSKIRGM